ncbi:MAG: hypothetical protein ABI852_06850 [Gemmatimonadaceae bacterium]
MSAYNPNKQGWGFAAVVCLLTAGLFFTAKTIHARTYRHPRDPMTQQVYHDRDLAKEHEAKASEHAEAMPGMDHSAPAAEKPAAAAADSVKPPEAKKH